MQTDRQMGEQAGWFEGLEVENTQFAGMPTVFFSRMRALVNAYESCQLPVADAVRHIFIAPMNPKFFGADRWSEALELPPQNAIRTTTSILITIARHFLNKGYRVTFELNQQQGRSRVVTELRREYPHGFCALIALEIPQHELGAYAVKIVPSYCFDTHENEGGVSVIPSDVFAAGYYRLSNVWSTQHPFTPWSAYEKDQDGH